MDEAIAGKLAQRTGVVSQSCADHCPEEVVTRESHTGHSCPVIEMSLASEEAGASEEAVTRNSLGGGSDKK